MNSSPFSEKKERDAETSSDDGIDRGSRIWGLGSGEQNQPEPFSIISVSENIIPYSIQDLLFGPFEGRFFGV